MSTFFYILINIIFPIFVLVTIGFVVQKKFHLDIRTLTRISMYVFIPALLITKIYEAKVSLQFFGTLFIYIMGIQLIMMILGEGIPTLLKYPKSIRKCFSNSLLFFNSGNYGLPLVELVFKHDPIATTAQVFIMVIQNITTNTIGVFQASTGSSSRKEALKNVFSMPSMYVLIGIGIVKWTGITIPDPILVPLQYITNGFVGFALILLGVQLGEIKFEFKIKDIAMSSFIRLILSPLIGFGLVQLLGVQGILAKSLIIGASTPTAVNTAIIAKEFDNEPEYAAQMVFVSTILSSITISTVIYIVTTYL